MTDPLIVTVTQEVVGVSTSVDTIKVDMGVGGPQGIQGPAGDLDATIFDAKGDLIGASAADTAVRIPAGTVGQFPIRDDTATSGISWLDQPWLNVKDPRFGAVGDGTTDDTSALQAAADALPTSGGTLYIPDGDYVHDGTWTISKNHVTILFGGDAWLEPTAGAALTISGASPTRTPRIIGPRWRVQSGSTATRGIHIKSSVVWATIIDPVCISFVAPPAGYVAIDVEDNCYWCRVEHPAVRKNSGGTSGDFFAGIAFRNVSNAGRVIGGSLNHCTHGVYVEGSNSIVVDAPAFESGTNGVTTVDPVSPNTDRNGGLIVRDCRSEAMTYLLNIAQTLLPVNPLSYFQCSGNLIVAGAEINNPNSVPVYASRGTEGIWINGLDKAISLRQGTVQIRDLNGHMIVEGNGRVDINSDKDNNGSGEIRFLVGPSVAATFHRSDSRFEIEGPLDHDGSTVGFFGTTPASQPAANPDTSGATLSELETEVNELKAALRSLGIIAT